MVSKKSTALKTKKKRPPRRPTAARRQRAQQVGDLLAVHYSDAYCALIYDNPFQLLLATILSAQCTDERVNQVTPILFKRYPTPKDLASAQQHDVEKIIHSTGFYRNKATSLIQTAQRLTDHFDQTVPQTMEDLLTLRGVARKTANVVLGNCFNINVGVVVDTHVKRLTHRMGLTTQTQPDQVERDLMQLFPSERWTQLSHQLIWHGRQYCDARRPQCDDCPIKPACRQIGV